MKKKNTTRHSGTLSNDNINQVCNESHRAAETFADKVLRFHKKLSYTGQLPPGFEVLNPIQDTEGVFDIMSRFYKKYYNDKKSRKFIIGINPGRLGAGTTGIPFTDSKRLASACDILSDLPSTHEVSAQFVYEMIAAYGGVECFYNDVYIQSMFPLALVRQGSKAGWVNCNYYDDPRLIEALMPYMRRKLKEQVAFGVDQSMAYVLGKKNAKYFMELNDQEKLFDRVSVLPHPRYIQQYRSKEKDIFIREYIDVLKRNSAS